MPIPQLPGSGLNSLDDVKNYIIRLERELRFLMESGLDSTNMFEVGGWRVKPYQFAFKDNMVGMSSAGTLGTSIRFWAGSATPSSAPFRVQHDGTIYSTKGFIGGFVIGTTSLTDAAGMVGLSSAVTAGDDIRIWAGNATPANAPFRVTESGSVYGSNFTLEGGVIRTAATGARIELSNNSVKTYNSSNQLNGPVWGTDAGGQFGDTYFYHAGAQLMVIFDELTNYLIRGVAGSTGFAIGGTVTTTGRGTWEFANTGSVDMQGTFKVHTGTAFDTISQADTSGLTLAQLEAELNTLKSNLRLMNILA